MRKRISQESITPIVEESKIGALVVFDTPEDPHTPVMLPAYDHLEKYLEMQVPLVYVDAKSTDQTTLNHLLVYSSPTLLWLTEADRGNATCILRVVGICNKQKLESEADKAIATLLPDE